MRAWPGSPYPLGATWNGSGVNFAIVSEHATEVKLCLFDRPDATVEAVSIPLIDRTDGVWHVYLPDVSPGQLYGYRISGPWDPGAGMRFNPTKVLLDPYSRAIGREVVQHPSLYAFAPGSDGDGPANLTDSAAYAPLGLVIDDTFGWGADRPPNIPWPDTVIYELHVKGFTATNPHIDQDLRGTYLGLACEPAIAHLKRIGITAVELLPVHAHADERDLLARGLVDYWGYNTLSYFAPDARFAASREPADAVRDFKTMVRALHAAGLEVILDVVYNHTAEGNHLGPTLSWRGIDNPTYYRLAPGHPSRYEDFTGCGNTLNMQSPAVLQLVMDSLRYWVQEMHVDGFRFDLASALARELHAVDRLSSFFDVIGQDPVISRVKLIAEPWDVGDGGYQVGNFPPGWAEWNGQYRDAVRRFWRGDAGMLPELATRVAGSSDLYGPSGRQPHASINFVTAHDGFTLADLVTYNTKHNEANGEDNRDGDPNNLSWNCGVEGPTSDTAVVELRRQQQRNFLLTLLVSLGVPMISGGDELGRTQGGNNNAYCHDSPRSWTDWRSTPDRLELLGFVRRLVALRAAQPVLRRRTFLGGHRSGTADVRWLRPDTLEMTDGDWADHERRVLGILFDGDHIMERGPHGEAIQGETLLIWLNADAVDVACMLPVLSSSDETWQRLVDSSEAGELDDLHAGGETWTIKARSAAIFKKA